MSISPLRLKVGDEDSLTTPAAIGTSLLHFRQFRAGFGCRDDQHRH